MCKTIVLCLLSMQSWLLDEEKLRQRLLKAAAINLVLAPFLLMFLVIYFFMKHAERFYHSPGVCCRLWGQQLQGPALEHQHDVYSRILQQRAD